MQLILRISVLAMFVSSFLSAQSIRLSNDKAIIPPTEVKAKKMTQQPSIQSSISPHNQVLKLVEFRDAKLGDVLKLIEKASGLRNSTLPESALFGIRLENTTWDELLKIIEEQASP